MPNTHLATSPAIEQRIKINLIRSLCTEFEELTLFDLQELIESHPTLAGVLGSITVGDLMTFEEPAEKPSKKKTNGNHAPKATQEDAEVLARVAKLRRPSLELGPQDYALEVLDYIQAAGEISQPLLAHAIHDPASESAKRRTYIRVQRAAKRLVLAGKVKTYKRGSVVYHCAKK